MSRSAGECFLCGEEGKGRLIQFYSGERKGGSHTELLASTVTVGEWWKDLQMHEIHVCRDCQERLWAEHVKWPPILCGVAAAVLLAPVVPSAILGGVVGLAIAGVLTLAALAAGGAGVWFYTQRPKPQRDRLEPLIVRAAAGKFIDKGRTYITSEKYIDLVDRGVIG